MYIMLIFIDSADLSEILELSSLGIISGVTTNPNLLKGNALDSALQINKNTGYKISYQPKSSDWFSEANQVLNYKNQLILKSPPEIKYFSMLKELISKGLEVNMTLVFNTNQAILAAQLGVKYISIFVGRLEDSGVDPFEVISDVRELYDFNNINTKIIAASIRNESHMEKSAISGAHIATVKPSIIKKMFTHELTSKGMVDFDKNI